MSASCRYGPIFGVSAPPRALMAASISDWLWRMACAGVPRIRTARPVRDCISLRARISC